jgi:uncharacterized protein (TIGR00266 family)
MQTVVHGSPSFAYITVDLEPGESVIAEADAMSSMDADLDMTARFNGGLVSAVAKRFLGGESLFVNEFRNNTQQRRRVTLVQQTPGDVREVALNGNAICLQQGAYIASTPGLKLGVQYAGLGSFIGREGLFRLIVSGQGTLWYGAYGGLVDRRVDGEYIVDSSHLVSYEPHMKLKPQLAGGIFGSFFGGEGLVTRVEGSGAIVIQTRSISGLAGWLNPRIR